MTCWGCMPAQLSDAEAVADEREQARDRLLGYYLTSADAADDHLTDSAGRQKCRRGSLTVMMRWHGWMPSGPTW